LEFFDSISDDSYNCSKSVFVSILVWNTDILKCDSCKYQYEKQSSDKKLNMYRYSYHGVIEVTIVVSLVNTKINEKTLHNNIIGIYVILNFIF